MKNAQAAGKRSIKTMHTNMDYAVLEELKRFGFVKRTEIKGRAPKKTIDIVLNKERPIHGVKFLSKPSLRKYSKYDDLRSVKGGTGILLVSTSKGIMAGVRARKEKVGGQVLFEIW
jgi:small subunit ribosomal protein S8